MSLWLHQERGIAGVHQAIADNYKRVCLTSPTGGGKTRMMIELIESWLRDGHEVALYTNRRMLLTQLKRVLESHGIYPGVQAAGFTTSLEPEVQLCMTQTIGSRVYKNKKQSLPRATRVIVDECHVQKGPVMGHIMADHVKAGAHIVGFTATPLDIGGMYEHLVVAGTNSELRQCGAHVPCYMYGPDEPDTRHVKRQKSGEYKEGDVRKIIMTSTIFGRVFDWHKKLNPDLRPSILFAPGVKESLWFAEEYVKQGISAAHISGDSVWVNGEKWEANQESRDEVLRLSEAGKIKVICNRFVLREGIDAPWLYHGIFATVFGALTSYLQSGGRLIRSHPSLENVVLQCHGGNWHRHGSLNSDRRWELGDTDYKVTALRERLLRKKKEPEPFACPKCAQLRLSGPTCPKCGHTAGSTRTRQVVQHDGSLKEMSGDIYKPRPRKKETDSQKKWDSCYWGARKAGRSFAAAEAWFVRKHGYWPSHELKNMPRVEADWMQRVDKVPNERLVT